MAKPRRYGLLRPAGALASSFVQAAADLVSAGWRQRRLLAGRGAKIAFDVRVEGPGDVILGEGVDVGRGVLFRVGAKAVIEIGAGSRIGPYAVLDAADGQTLRLGARFTLGSQCQIVCAHGMSWGDDGSLGDGSFLGPSEPGGRGVLTVGAFTHLHNYNSVDLCADVTIGDEVQTGPYCALYTHDHTPAAGALIWEQAPSFAPITIGSGVWVGHNCCILPGVNLGEGSVLASGAVANRSIEAWRVAGGVPARTLRSID